MPHVFAELIAARDLTLSADADWTTPSTDDLPNTDHATQATSGASSAAWNGTEMAIPWGISDFTVEHWVHYTGAATGVNLYTMVYGNAASATRAWDVRQPGESTRKQRFALYDSGGSVYVDNEVVIPDQTTWHHVVFTLNSALGLGAVSGRQLKSYLDGSLVNTVNLSTGALSQPTLTGAQFRLGFPGSSTLTFAEIGKVAIYHRAITATEIADHYAAMTT